ncbi:putative aspartyl protease family A22B [Tribonema minus]|uniref:Putative aspartyl protease family A22B n=1 Tax=Tribonema minus TaxID=303371 RepID=A0A835Z5W1_9STRA|nr:putative aspartyl protease family A22B [Tribonema minus]
MADAQVAAAPEGSNKVMLACYVAMFTLWGLAQVVLIPVPVNLISMSTIIIYVGAHRSLRLRDKAHPDNAESETLSKEDAMKFPLVGSATLFGLYMLFKLLDKDMVNLVLSVYFSGMGALTLAGTFDPLVHVVVKSETLYGRKFNLPWVGEVDLTFTPSGLVSLAFGLAFGAVYFQTKHWTMNNILGISFCVQALERISLGSYKIGAILLVGLFFYDIFWVFGTEVMVTVAKSFDGPIKLVFPRKFGNPLADPPIKAEFSMLGLGDIVIPGLFVALLLRYDAHSAGASPALRDLAAFAKPFFHTNIVAYVLGLVATMVVMYQFDAAQPALLYLVPACLVASLVPALARKEFGALLAYSEEDEEKAEEKADGKPVAGADAKKTK